MQVYPRRVMSELARSLLDDESRAKRMIRIECRYLYSQLAIDDLSDQFDVPGEEIREYLTRSEFLLRVRW